MRKIRKLLAIILAIGLLTTAINVSIWVQASESSSPAQAETESTQPSVLSTETVGSAPTIQASESSMPLAEASAAPTASSSEGTTASQTSGAITESATTPAQPSAPSTETTIQNIMPATEVLSDWMPDPLLQEQVAQYLGITIEEITKEQMLLMNSFSLYSSTPLDIDLKGLEYATNMQSFYLSIPGLDLSTYDFSVFSNLQSLGIVESNALSLNLTNLPNLTSFYLVGNPLLRSLTIKDLPLLNNINIGNNTALEELQIANLPALTSLDCSNNTQLSTLQMNDLPLVQSLYLYNNHLSQISLTNLPLVADINLQNNYFTNLQNLQLSGVSSGAHFDITNQIIAGSARATVNQSTTIPALIDYSGSPIPYVIPGVSGVDYTLTNTTEITWLTPGLRTLTSSLNFGIPSISYSISYPVTVLAGVDEWLRLPDFTAQTNNLISNSFSRNGINFRIDSGINESSSKSPLYLNENHKVTNLTTGEIYTYTYYGGAGTLSNLWYNKLGNSSYENFVYTGAAEIYMKQNADGSEMLKKIYHTTLGLDITITTWVTAGGEIRHLIESTNVTANPLADLALLTRIDTQLNSDDYINLYATGSGGVYMKSGTFMLYGEPLTGTTKAYAGRYHIMNVNDLENNLNGVSTTFGVAADTALAMGVDSGMYFGPSRTTLNPGETISFSYQERIFSTAEPPPVPNNAVTVQYTTEDGTILDEEDLVGNPGATYNSSAKDFDDYELVRVDGSATGTFTYDPQTVTYVYTLKAGAAITVNYVNDQGSPLETAVSLSGKVTTAYTSAEKTFENYQLLRIEGNATGTFTYTPQTVTYVYTLKTAAPVTIKFLDQDGNTLSQDVVLTGKVTQTYSYSIPGFSGYRFLQVESLPQAASAIDPASAQPLAEAATTEVNGIFSLQAQVYTCRFQKENPPANYGYIIVKYLDAEGNSIQPDLKQSGLISEKYQVSATAIEGYSWFKTEGSENGLYTDQEQVITYFYKKSDVNPGRLGGDIVVSYLDQDGKSLTANITLKGQDIGLPYQTEQKAFTGYTFVKVEGNPQGTYTDQSQKVTYHYQKTDNIISKTGEVSQGIWIILGVVAVGAAGAIILIVFRRRKKTDKEG